ncbi:N-terminal nucleophile aminohydrolase [Dentipellis sp. KUC8613]|nr:N-terminal nucleophile aminohydrolase [Dentipellis sp. KUC8613]
MGSEPLPYYVVAVHGGAGAHSSDSELSVKRALRAACASSCFSLASGSSALDAVTHAISSLEDAEPLNAGYGSNLTLSGDVECDASLMDGRTSNFGAVGAVRGVKNPIRLARAVADARMTKDALGRVPPLLVAGTGAEALASANGVERLVCEAMVSPRARREWEYWKARLDGSPSQPHPSQDASEHTDAGIFAGAQPQTQTLHARQDTVGAVALDSGGNVAAGASSGGLLLKPSGRIGEAAIFGAGCCARQARNQLQGTVSGQMQGMACSVSGTGELIIETALAKVLADALERSPDEDAHEVLRSVLVDKFYKEWIRRGEDEPNAGVLLLTKEAGDASEPVARLWCAFTTPSMAIGYVSSTMPKPIVKILRNPTHSHNATHPPFYITSLPLHVTERA